MLKEKLSVSSAIRSLKDRSSLTATSELEFDCLQLSSINLYNFRASFLSHPKAERQAKLLKEFGFVCECEACIKNFPTPPALNYKDMKLLKFAKKADDGILKLNPSQAMKKYRECCDILEKNHQSFPSIELCLLQKFIVKFLVIQGQPSVKFS